MKWIHRKKVKSGNKITTRLFTLCYVFFMLCYVIVPIIFSHYKSETIKTKYDIIVENSPKEIANDYTETQSVRLICEDVLVYSGNKSAKTGVATFEKDNQIYMFGHKTDEQVGSSVYIINKDIKNSKTVQINELETEKMLGKITVNNENGVIAEGNYDTSTYPIIRIGNNARLGKAYFLQRDKNGEIQKYSIEIEAFSEENGQMYYSSSEVQFIPGTSGSPIIQDGKLIGVNMGVLDGEKIGVGRVIWNLEIF